MGHGDDESPQAASRRGAPLTHLRRLGYTARLGLALAALAALWTLAGVALFEQARARSEARIADAAGATRALVSEAQRALVREVGLLARDPAVVEGVTKGDWGTLARGASPRMVSLTTEHVADLLVITDPAGEPLVQVPALPRLSTLEVPATPSAAFVRVINGQPYLLSAASVGRAGVAVAGRRFDSIADLLGAVPSQPVVVALSGDRLVASSRGDLPGSGWAAATRSGTLRAGGRTFTVSPLNEALWTLVPTTDLTGEYRRMLWWLAGSWVVAALVLVFTALTVMARPRRMRDPDPAVTSEERRRQSEAFHGIVRAVERSDDLSTGLGAALEVVRELVDVTAALIYRVEPRGRLVLVAQRGVPAERVDGFTARPLEGSDLGEAVRRREIVATRFHEAIVGCRAQASVPIPVGDDVWGVLALLTDHERVPRGAARQLETIALLFGSAIAQAGLRDETDQKSRRLESLTRLAQTLTGTLALEEVLQRVVDAGVWIFHSSVARLWLMEDDGEHLGLRASAGTRSNVAGITRLPLGEGLVGMVAVARRPLTVLDVMNDPRIRNVERLRAESSVSLAGVPLTIGDRVLGVLTTAVRERHEYRPDELELLQSLANYAAIAIDNARLFAEEKVRRDQLAALLDINTKIGAAEPTDALLGAIAEEAARLLDVDNAGFRLVDGDSLVLAGLAGTAAETMVRPRVKIGESFSGRVVAEGRTLMVEAGTIPDMDPEHRLRERQLGYTYYLGVPLRVGDRVIGAFAFRARRRFSARDQELAEAFAGQAAVALEHARLYRETTRHVQRMAVLAEVERELVAELDLDRLLTLVVERTSRLFGAEGVIYLLEAGDVLAPSAWTEGAAIDDRIPVGVGLVGSCAEQRRGLLVNDYPTSSFARPEFVEVGTRHAIAQPLVIRERLVGVIAMVRFGATAQTFGDEDLAALDHVAAQAAIALANARLYEETELGRREAEELAEVARTFTERLEISAVGQRIVDSVLDVMRVRSAGLRLIQPDGALVAVAWGGHGVDQFRGGHVQQPGTGLAARAIAAGRPVWSSRVLDDPELMFDDDLRARVEASASESVLAVPLSTKGRVIGVLLITDEAAHQFSERDVRLAQAFADQAALALESARLHEETDRARRDAEELARLARMLTETLDYAEVQARIVENVPALFGVSSTGLRLLRGDGGLVAVAEGGTPGTFIAGNVLPAGHGLAGRAVAEGRAVWSADVLNDAAIVMGDDLRRIVELSGNRAFMSAPLKVKGRIIGALTLGDHTVRNFSPTDAARLQAFADQAALALDNARLHEEAEQRRREAEVVAALGRTINESLDVDTVLQRVAEGAKDLCRSDIARVALRDPERDRLTFRYCVGARYEGYEHLTLGERGVSGVVIATGRSFRTENWLADARIRKHGEISTVAQIEAIVTELAVPVTIGGRVEGLVTVSNRTERPFTDREEEVLQRLADHAAIAIQNARLYAQARDFGERLRMLEEVNRQVSSSLQMDQVLRNVATAVARFVDVPVMNVWVLDPETQRLRRSLSLAPAAIDAGLPREMASTEGGVGWVATHREPILWADIATDLRFLARDVLLEHGLRFVLAYPIAVGDRVLGVFAMNRATPGVMTAESQTILASLAAQAALAIDHAHLYSEAEEQLRETTTLLSVGHVLSEPLPVNERLRRVSRETARAFGADMAGAYILDEASSALVPVAGYRVPAALRARLREHRIVLAAQCGLADAWRTGEVIASSDVHADSRLDPAWSAELPDHAMLLAPLRAHGASMGALYLVWWTSGRAFSAREVRLIEGVARQVSLALENAELTRQREIKLRETETLLSVSRTLSSTLDLDALLRQFLRQTAAAFGADTVGAYLLDDDGEFLIPRAGYRVPRRAAAAVRALQLSTIKHAFYADAARTRRPQFSRDVVSDPRLPDAVHEALPHRSQLFVPILVKDRLIGGFIAVWFEPRQELSSEELSLLEGVANQAGVAVENARLFEENRRQVAELSALHEMARAMTGQLDHAALLETLRVQVPRVVASRKLIVIMADEHGDLEVVLRVIDGASVVDESTRRYRRSVGLGSIVLDSARPFRTDDYPAEVARRGFERPPLEDSDCWLGAPLIVDHVVLGVLAVSRDRRPFSEDDERLVANIADLAALALRSARLYEDRTRAYSELAATQDHLVRTEKLHALGEMASGVAHDFNNLLAAILGRAQLLLRRVSDPQLHQWLQVIERSALDGAQTVRRLQDFARVRQDQPLVPVSLNDVVRDALDITQSRWREESLRRGVVIDVRTSLSAVATIVGDAAELREAMTNLILNAVDAMPAGGTLTLTTRSTGDGIELAVGDTGVGMPETVRDRIFDPFFTTKGPQGTGLGLSMTYGIVARHRGTIVVESEEGRGSTFRITFPAETTAPEAQAPPKPAPAPAVKAFRCLVVDDEEAVGAVIGDVLDALGQKAVVVTKGAAAIELFRAEPFDVVFTDLAMPGVSGWDVVAAVKKIAPAVPVFVVTGFGVELSRAERIAHDVEAVYPKPLKIEDIMDAVARVARRREQGAEGSR